MIIFNNDKTEYKDPTEALNKLDGTYYGVICNVFTKDVTADEKNSIFTCSLYIPEVFGKYENPQNYPTVDIPFCQDNDDEGYQPQIGDICKVMFENGKSFTARLLYLMTISPQSRKLNSDYILYGISPSEVIDRPSDREDLSLFTGEMLDLAYYITTGHTKSELTLDDFMPCVLGSATSGKKDYSKAKNYFCKALGMPFVSYFNDDIYGRGVPIEASEIYSAVSMFKSLYNNNIEKAAELSYVYTDSKYSLRNPDIGAPCEVYAECKGKVDELDSKMLQFTLATLAYVNPRHINLLFPDIGDDLPDEMIFAMHYSNYTQAYCYAERLWDTYANTELYEQDFYMLYPKIMFNLREYIEKQWASSVPVFISGFNNAMSDSNNTKLKYTVVLCLTICPWLAYPLIRQYSNITLNEQLNALLQENGIMTPMEFRTYATYITNDEEFTNVSLKLRNMLKDNVEPKNFVTGFRDVAYSLFGTGYLNFYGLYDERTWDYFNMDAKFKRLQDKLSEFLETVN